MAGQATPIDKKQSLADLADASLAERQDLVVEAAARLYGLGFKRAQVADILLEPLTIGSMARTREQKQHAARLKLRRWEAKQDFRDAMYKHAIIKLDMETPDILKGLVSRAKRGRVDATKLVLELTGRHSQHRDVQPAAVVINIGASIPRPEVRGEIVEGTAEEVED